MSENIDKPQVSSEPLKGNELKSVLKSLSEERGLDPVEIDRFLKLDPESAKPLRKIDLAYPGIALGVHLVTRAIVDTYPELPKGPELPLLAHNFLQAVYALPNMAAASPALLDHLPYISFTLGVIWAGKNTLPKWLSGDAFVGKVKSSQEQVAGKVLSGEMRYKMKEGHTAAFVGKGDTLADELQKEKGGSMVMKYADVPITENVWQLIKSTGSQEEIFQALDRADFSSAGEVLILPVKAEDMVLPGPDGHDMSLDQIAAKIKICSDYCKSRGIDQKRIIVIGDIDHAEVYSMRTAEKKVTTKIKTLRQLLDDVKSELSAEGIKVEILSEDPTKDTMKEVARLAGGRKIEYHATHESDNRYGERFYHELGLLGYKVNSDITGNTRVFYNIDDIPTEMNIDSDDIAIVLDPSVRNRLVAKGGFSPENIICPPELMQKKLSHVVEQT